MKNYWAGLVLLLAAPVVADDHVAVVEQAFANISDDYHREWAFTESVTDDGVTTVGRYDPRLPKDARWALLSVDGRLPTADETADYQDDKEDEFHDDDDHKDGELDIVDVDTLELVEETAEYWTFSFAPKLGDEEDEEARKLMKSVTGTVKVIRSGNYLESIDMRNEKPVRPAFSVKISRFMTHLTFGPVSENGPIVPLSIDVEVKGRAAMIIKIDEREATRYSDYEYVGT